MNNVFVYIEMEGGRIADYAITGDVNEVIPKMIKYYKQNSK